MDGISCNNCATPMHESDIFCRRCGAKRQLIGAESEACFCPKCGNSLRSGARFCDMCGEEFAAQEGGETHPRGERGKRRRKGCIRKLLVLILLLGIAVAAATNWHILLPIVEDFAAKYLGVRQTAVEDEASEDIASLEQSHVVLPAEEESPAEVRETVFSDPVLDISPDTSESPIVIALPVTEEPETISPDLSVFPDLTISPDLPISPDLSISPTYAEEPSERAEVVWTEIDEDGYSFLFSGDPFAPVDEVRSVRGTVSGDNVRVRTMPNTRGQILRGLLNRGDTVEVTGRRASDEDGYTDYYWFRIRRAGEIGWVYGQFLQVESTGSEVEGIILQAVE